jgi:hypothetical protein
MERASQQKNDNKNKEEKEEDGRDVEEEEEKKCPSHISSERRNDHLYTKFFKHNAHQQYTGQ